MMAKIVIVLTLLVVITEARFLDRERDIFQDTSKLSVRVQILVYLMFNYADAILFCYSWPTHA